MNLRLRRTWVLATVGALISLFLLQYAYWLYLIRQAHVALQQEEQVMLASDRYGKAIGWTPPLVSRFARLREPLREALLKQAQILFLQHKVNEGLEFFQTLRSQYPFLESDWEYHLWYGNALFLRAVSQNETQALVNDMEGASREYRTALEFNPASWDARFNYELIKQALVAESEQGLQKLKLLLDENPRDQRRQDQVPPEKVG